MRKYTEGFCLQDITEKFARKNEREERILDRRILITATFSAENVTTVLDDVLLALSLSFFPHLRAITRRAARAKYSLTTG